VGETCTPGADSLADSECQLLARCDEQTRKCVMLGQTGQPCDGAQGGRCLLGSVCDTSIGTCRADDDPIDCAAP
jgi:hypothetical protein